MQGPLNTHEIRKLLLFYPARAVRILHDHYGESLREIAFRLTHDRDVSKEIVQDAFVYIWQNSKKLGNDRERSIEHYLVGIVRNKSITHYRSNQRSTERKAAFFEAQFIDLSDPSIESRIIHIEVTQEILEVIARFPKRERECLMMRIDDGMGNEEIASRLGVGTKAVERSLGSAKRRLRRWLQLKV